MTYFIGLFCSRHRASKSQLYQHLLKGILKSLYQELVFISFSLYYSLAPLHLSTHHFQKFKERNSGIQLEFKYSVVLG
jgi:hypothetical protein